jgi:hypothetical protein
MSEKIESTELVNELAMEQSEKDAADSQIRRWHKQVALSSLLFALLAALGGLLSGITAQESQNEKIEEVFNLTILEGDQVRVDILKAKYEILSSLGEIPDEAESETIRELEEEIDEKRKEITQEENFFQTFGQTHLMFAISVTILAVGISLGGMSVVIEQKWLWVVGMAAGVLGSFGVVAGIITMLA